MKEGDGDSRVGNFLRVGKGPKIWSLPPKVVVVTGMSLNKIVFWWSNILKTIMW